MLHGVRRTAAVLAACLALVGAVIVPAAPASAAGVTYTYEVRGRGNTTGLEDFAARAAQTYAGASGWGLGGSIRFVRVAAGGNFTLWLSAPQYLPAFAGACSTQYSCRVGRNVIINEARFRGGSSAWNATGAGLRDYQHMVVNHETGHWLGFGHRYCGGAGQQAPVMQQQSKSLQGCRPNAWPSAAERRDLSRAKGVPIIVPPPAPPPGPPRIRAGQVVSVAAAGAAGVPADAEAVGLNVAVADPENAGHVTVYPCDAPVPGTSNLNFAAGQTRAAFTLAGIGPSGRVCARSSVATHLVLDVSGYIPAGAGYEPVAPRRLVDTRSAGAAAVRQSLRVELPPGTAAAALTVTAVGATGPGHAVAHPCGEPVPLASNLNFVPGPAAVANLVLARPAADGAVCVESNAATHLIVDIVGRYPAGSGFVATSPVRLIDTRTGTSPTAVTRVAVPLTGTRALNLTVTAPADQGWARAYPCGSAEPATTNINFQRGATAANALIAAGGADGTLCIRSSAPAHIIVDDSGAVGGREYRPVPAVRLLDTRRS